MIILPNHPRPALLRSFWLAVSVAIGVFIGVLAALPISPLSFGWGAICAIAFAVPGLIWPQQIVVKPYKIFNKVAHFYARGMRLLLLGVCFYITFWGIGRTGSVLNLDRPTPDSSLWVPRRTLAQNTYSAQWAGAQEKVGRKGWVRHLLTWTFHSGNLWAVCLLPFLFLLMPLEKEDEIAFPPNIYTLF